LFVAAASEDHMNDMRIKAGGLILALAVAGWAENPIIQTNFTADPAPMVWNDTVFLYTSHDEDNATGNGGFQMKNWMLYTSTDMVNWRDRGVVASLANFKWGPQDNGAWAVQTIQRNGKFYLYAPLHGKGIGVLVADSPYGPFKDPLGKALVNADPWAYIDPTAMIDSDGQAYLYFGNPDAYFVKLNSDMISTSGSITKHPKISTYQEGPWIYKHGSNYYLAFASTCCPEGIGYAMSSSPTGPWTYKGSIMDGNSKSSGNHPGIIDFKGKSYVFGFNYAINFSLGTQQRERRSISLSEMKYNADGTIAKLPWWGGDMPSVSNVSPVDSLNPYVQTEAETMAWSKGVKTESSSDGGMDLTSLENGDYIKLKSVDFAAGASSFDARVASATSGGSIEIRLDSETGKLVGTLAVTGTGGVQTWTTKSCTISGASGVHDLFLVFKGGSGSLFNFNWWKFTAIGAATRPSDRTLVAGFHCESTPRGLVVRAESPLEQVRLVSAAGRVWELGRGTEIRLDAADFGPGVYRIVARSGSETMSEIVPLGL
jgi:hypothetical protein